MESHLEDISLAEVLRISMASRLTDLHVAMPAKVDAYNAGAQTVDVTPQLNRHLPDGAGHYVHEKLPKLIDVPVCFPRGGGFFASFPIAKGDYVLLVFAEKNIGVWRGNGTQGDPGDIGMHTLDGAIAIPGVYPDAGALSDAHASNMVIGKDGGKAIHITPTNTVLLGSSSAIEKIVLGTTYRAAEDALFLALDTLMANLKTHIVDKLIPASGVEGSDVTTMDGALSGWSTAYSTFLGLATTFLSNTTKTD